MNGTRMWVVLVCVVWIGAVVTGCEGGVDEAGDPETEGDGQLEPCCAAATPSPVASDGAAPADPTPMGTSSDTLIELGAGRDGDESTPTPAPSPTPLPPVQSGR